MRIRLGFGVMLAAGTLMISSLPAAASGVDGGQIVANRSAATSRPDFENYSKRADIHARCASYKGEIAWGRHDIVEEYYVETNGLLDAADCKEGKAILHLHYDTVSNPRAPLVGHVDHGYAKRVGLENEDWLNSYKDIYVELCYVGLHGACVNFGPGAPRRS